MLSVKARLARVFEGCGADSLLLMNTLSPTSNFLYLTGMASGLFEFSPLVVTRHSETLLTYPLEYEIARRTHPAEMEVRKMGSQAEAYGQLAGMLKGKVVGVDCETLPKRHYDALRRHSKAKRFVDASECFARAREVKLEDEIALIRKANRISLGMLGGIEDHFREGMTELELAARVDYEMKERGAEGPSFQTIVCFGENAALPHHAPGQKRLERNTFVLIDCGARYRSYCSDTTRTFIFRPERGSRKFAQMEDMISTVARAQSEAMPLIRAGLPGKEAHLRAAQVIDTASGGRYNGMFIHSLGHSLGIDVHDLGPRLGPSVNRKLEENMVLSNEPGIYMPGFGGVRIEDDIVVTKRGGRLV